MDNLQAGVDRSPSLNLDTQFSEESSLSFDGLDQDLVVFSEARNTKDFFSKTEDGFDGSAKIKGHNYLGRLG